MMLQPEHDFDVLDEWSSLTDAEMNERYTEESRTILRRLLDDLATDDKRSVQISRENFAKLIRELRELKRQGSRSLGDAIISASRLLDEQKYEEARSVYRIFLDTNQPRFFRRIATRCLEAIVIRS